MIKLLSRWAAMICCGIAVGTHFHNGFYGFCTALAMSALFPAYSEPGKE